MKKLRFLLLGLLLAFVPMNVFASNASIKVSAPGTVMSGNTVTVTVTLSSGSKMGSWQADLNYDKSYLQLTSSTGEGGGTGMVNSSAGGTKSKSYTFKFKTLKTGSTKVSVGGYSIYDYDTLERMTTSAGSATINIKTKEEIEASYSANADLKSLSVGDYPLTPGFNKDTVEYTVEVENEIETVTISASKADGNATVSGTGEKNLVEGNNKFEIVVTAQKGNTKTYVVNVNRNELDPIIVKVNGQDLTLVRRADQLIENPLFTPKTVKYGEDEIPALYSEITGITIVGLKDEDGNITMYVLEDEKVTIKYVEIKTNGVTIIPQDLPEDDIFSMYTTKEIEIDGMKVKAYLLSKDSKFAVIYAQDIETGDVNYYSYHIKDKTVQVFDKEMTKQFNDKLTKYKYVMLGLVGVIIILLFILIVRKPKAKKIKEDKELVKTIEEKIDEEIDEEVSEKTEDDVIKLIEKTQNIPLDSKVEKKKKKKDKKKKKKEEEEVVEEIPIEEEVKEENKEEVSEDTEEIADIVGDNLEKTREYKSEDKLKEIEDEEVEENDEEETPIMTRRELRRLKREEKERERERRDFDF